MKTRQLVLGFFVCLLSLVFLTGCATTQKLWYGTWTSEKGVFHKSVHTPGLVQDFASLTDAVPAQEVKVRTVSCWSDSEGNVWFKNECTITSGPFKGKKVQNLEKISKSGALLEVMPNFVSDFTANGFPTKIDPDYQFYMAFSRVVK